MSSTLSALTTAALLATLSLGCKSSDPGKTESSAPATARTAQDTTRRPTPTGDALLRAADAGRIQGDSAAQVWLIIISDFQCPYCRMWHDETYTTLVRDYVQTGKLRMAYINLPLEMHPNAFPAAEAAMCAAPQGKFWAMHDAIFHAQERWSNLPNAMPQFDSLATAAGVQMADWRSCVSEHRTRPVIAADQERAQQIGVRSTPSFILMKGQTPVRGIAGAQPVDSFRVAIDQALAGTGSR